MQDLADRAKLLRKEAKGVQHMVMKDEVRTISFSAIMARADAEMRIVVHKKMDKSPKDIC